MIKLHISRLKKGFTLIELLVVIAVMAVIASAVLVLMDPTDKTNSANDSKVQADIGQVGTAMVAYATSHGGVYPTTAETESVLTSAGDLVKLPTAPTGYATYTYVFNASGSIAGVQGDLKSKKYTNDANIYWTWCASSTVAAATKLKLTTLTYDARCP